MDTDPIIVHETFSSSRLDESISQALRWTNGNTRSQSKASDVVSISTFSTGDEFITIVYHRS